MPSIKGLTSTVMNNDEIDDQLLRKFEELSAEYETALNKDVEFSTLKNIYMNLKEIKAKLAEQLNADTPTPTKRYSII